MLDLICIGSAELFGMERERKIQFENICLPRDTNLHPEQVNQRFRPLDHIGYISSGVFIVLHHPFWLKLL